jgi:hypothetical protein
VEEEGNNIIMAWDPEEALRQERQLLDENPIEQATRELRFAVPRAVHELIELAMNGESEKIRLDACKYITERNLGPIAQTYLANAGNIDPLEDLIGSVVQEEATNTAK